MCRVVRAGFCAWVLLVGVWGAGGLAAAQDPEPRVPEAPWERDARREAERQAEQERRSQLNVLRSMAAGAAAVAPRRSENTGLSEAQRRVIALNDLMGFAAELQGLLSLRSSDTLESNVRDELKVRADRSLDAADKVLAYINRNADVESEDPVNVPDEPLGPRMIRLANLYERMVEPTVEVIMGDVLDLGTLRHVRAGFRAMEALIEAVPDSRLSVSETR